MNKPCKRQPKVQVDMDWWAKEGEKPERKGTYIEGPVGKEVNGKTKKQQAKKS